MVRFQTMTPEEYKANHVNFKILYAFHPTPFGDCLIGIRNIDKSVLHLSFVNKSNTEAFAELKGNWPLSELIEDTTNETSEIVKKIFSEPVFASDSILVLLKGTEFQIKVWEALTHIPEGTTITYAEIASNIGKPKAVRAVGNAVMKNNIAYLVPCHRVRGISSNKYKWGIKMKENILAHECKYLDT